jgi:hypothetical protein
MTSWNVKGFLLIVDVLLLFWSVGTMERRHLEGLCTSKMLALHTSRRAIG